jgi:hypothetical protein
MLQEPSNHLSMALLTSNPEGNLPSLILLVKISSRTDEQLQNLNRTAVSPEMNRFVSLLVPMMDVTLTQQLLYNIRRTTESCEVETCPAPYVFMVWVPAMFQEELNELNVILAGRNLQCTPAMGFDVELSHLIQRRGYAQESSSPG